MGASLLSLLPFGRSRAVCMLPNFLCFLDCYFHLQIYPRPNLDIALNSTVRPPHLPHFSLQGCDGAGCVLQVPHASRCRLALPDRAPPPRPLCAGGRQHARGVSTAAGRRARQQRPGDGSAACRRLGLMPGRLLCSYVHVSANYISLCASTCDVFLPGRPPPPPPRWRRTRRPHACFLRIDYLQTC